MSEKKPIRPWQGGVVLDGRRFYEAKADSKIRRERRFHIDGRQVPYAEWIAERLFAERAEITRASFRRIRDETVDHILSIGFGPDRRPLQPSPVKDAIRHMLETSLDTMQHASLVYAWKKLEAGVDDPVLREELAEWDRRANAVLNAPPLSLH